MAGNLRDIIPAFFVGPGGQALTPEQVAQRQQVAMSLLQKATDTSPNAGGWASILAKGVQGGIAGYKSNQADNAITANNEYNSGLLGSLFSGGAPAMQTPAYSPSVAAGGSPTAPMATNVPSGSGVVDPAVIKHGLLDRGLPEHVADGFLMNFADESGFKPGVNEANPTVAGSRGGFGLYQLTGPRRVAYENFAQSRGVDPSNVDAQLDFLKTELNGPEKSAAQKIFAAPDAGSAAAAIAKNFLRPAESHLKARVNKYTTNPQRYAGGGDDPLADAAASGDETPNPNPTIAESLANAGNVGPQIAQSTSPVGIGMMPAGSGGTPILDVTQQPSLSLAAGLPFANDGGSVQANMPISQTPTAAPPLPAPVNVSDRPIMPSVAQSLAIRPQADPNDRLIAGADQTLQPTAQELGVVFPSAPSQPSQMTQLQSVIADPRANPQTKQIAIGLLQQTQQQQLSQQQAAQQLAQRQAAAQQMGINPAYASDATIWKAAVDQATRDNTKVVGTNLVDQRGKVVYAGQQPAPTTVQEYEYYKQQAGPNALPYDQWDLARRRSGAAVTNMGSIPQGYQLKTDPVTGTQSLEVIPGGPEDTSATDATAQENKSTTSDIITNAASLARKAIDAPGLPATGTASIGLANIPETNAAELRRQVAVLKSNASFATLNAMRAASPTGGALGSVSDKEQAMLSAASGALDPSAPTFKRDLDNYEHTLLRVVHGNKEGDQIFETTRNAGSSDGWTTLPNGVKIRQKGN